MARKANKTKAWRRETEVHMYPQEVETINEAGETVVSIVQTPFILKGRMLRDYRLQGGKSKPVASGLLVNLMFGAGLVTMVHDDAVASEVNETVVETV